METLAFNTTLAGLLIFILSLPLAWRRVPMNRFYGFRTRAAFRSDQRWYDINAYAGRQLAFCSVVIVACGVAGFLLPDHIAHVYRWISYAVVLTSLAVVIIRTQIWARDHE